MHQQDGMGWQGKSGPTIQPGNTRLSSRYLGRFGMPRVSAATWHLRAAHIWQSMANVTLRSPLSTPPMYDRSMSASAASSSCVQPSAFRFSRIRFPSVGDIQILVNKMGIIVRRRMVRICNILIWISPTQGVAHAYPHPPPGGIPAHRT
jgi:hypothetical protein